jgi:colanic acid/amylovoran biosynthesis glycosyltransferase
VRLAFVSSGLPFGRGDMFLEPEFRRLPRYGVDPAAIPMRKFPGLSAPSVLDRTIAHPLIDRRVLVGAARTVRQHPVDAIAAVLTVLRTRRLRDLVRNLAAVPKAFWLADLVTREGVDHIHAHWAGPPSTAAMLASDITGVPFSLTAHAVDIAANNLLARKCERAQFVRFIATEMMDLARRTEPGADESRWVLLHLGVEVVPQWSEPGPSHDPPVLLMVARLDPGKRHWFALAALRRLHDRGCPARLLVVGDGGEAGAVRVEVDRLGLGSDVDLLGQLPHDDLLKLLSAHEADAVVLPSEGEGIPVSLMEALAAGVPAVACDVGGVAELLGEDRGVLVGVDDLDGFVAGVERVLTDLDERRRLARRGRAHVESEFSADMTAGRFCALVQAAT